MATFQELLESLRNPGEDGPSETIYDDLTTAYDNDMGGASAKIAQATADLEAANGRITQLQAANWELHEQIPKAGDSEPGDGAETDTLEGEEMTLDSLIEAVED